MAKAKPTHIRNKTGEEVFVERHQGGVMVVRNKHGKVLGSYELSEMPKFVKRYKSLTKPGTAKRA